MNTPKETQGINIYVTKTGKLRVYRKGNAMNEDGYEDYSELKEWLLWGAIFAVSVVSFLVLVV